MNVVKWGEWDDTLCSSGIIHNLAYTKKDFENVTKAVKDSKYCFSGDYHQNGDYGVPYFEDGTPFMVSKREWGLIMAAAYPEIISKWREKLDSRKDGKSDYVAFAWDSPELKQFYHYPEGEKI